MIQFLYATVDLTLNYIYRQQLVLMPLDIENINSKRIAGLYNKTFCNFFDQQRTFLSSEGKQNLHNQRKENSILTGIQFLYASLLS